MKPESPDLRDYLKATDVIDWHNPEVAAKARDLAAGLHDEVEKARCIFEWVRDHIPHSKDIDSDVVTLTASEALREGTGACFAKSHLLAALLRANTIPAGFCYQVLKRDPPLKGMVLHGLNGIYLGTLNRWIRADARGNTGTIDAQFSLDEEKLAFPADPALGEFTHETIYCEPDPSVLDTLRRFTSRREMWPHLPSTLQRP